MKKRCRDGVTCVVLCTLPSIYLVCVVFGTAIPTSFYSFGICFSYSFYVASLATHSRIIGVRHYTAKTELFLLTKTFVM